MVRKCWGRCFANRGTRHTKYIGESVDTGPAENSVVGPVNEDGRAGDGVDEDLGAHPVEPVDQVWRQDIDRGALRDGSASAHRDDVVGKGEGVAEVVQGSQDRDAAVGEPAQQRQCVELSTDVEVVGRLVHEQQPRLLGKCCCQANSLLFAPGQRAIRALRYAPVACR
jgi:hypothetical protein